MNHVLRRQFILILLFAPLPLAARCQNSNSDASVRSNASNDLTSRSESDTAFAPSHDTKIADVKPAATQKSESTSAPASGPEYTLKFNYPPEKTLYLVVENNFTDRGGVPPILTFTSYADDKRSLIQTRSPQTAGAARPSQPGEVTLQWQCDRLEVRERGMKEEVKFDSLRDSYPRAELRELGTVPGSKVTFDINMRTGQARNRRIEHNKFKGPPTRRRLSRTAMRCAATEENLAKLMDDLGPLYFPGKPVRVGESWTQTRSEEVKSFGQTHLDYRFKLEQVKEVEGRQIAVISVGGDTRLIPEVQKEKPPPRPRPGAASQPATTQKAKDKPREFKIDRATCRGTIEFDLTRGELVSIDLVRERDLSATMESEEMPGLRLETGEAHHLRVQVLQSPPPKPLIAGGPKPPADDPPEPSTPAPRKTPNRFRQNPRPATQPARPILTQPQRPAFGRSSSQPYGRPGTATQPNQQKIAGPSSMVGPPYVSPTSRPATGRPPFRSQAIPSSRPATGGQSRLRPTSQPVRSVKPLVVRRPVSSQPASPPKVAPAKE